MRYCFAFSVGSQCKYFNMDDQTKTDANSGVF